MISRLWQKRLLRWTRDLVLLLTLLSLMEWWQARDLLQGQIPPSLQTLPLLEPDLTTSKPGYTLLYVFAPWCGVCRLSADNLNRLQSLDINVKALALSYRSAEEIKRFVTETGLHVPVLLGDEIIEAQLQIEAYPTHYLLSPEGKVLKAWQGYTTTLGFYWKVFWNRALNAWL